MLARFRKTIRHWRPATLGAIVALSAVLPAGVSCSRRQPPRPTAPHPRIVSFSPALTDILFGMGLGEHVVAVTNFCLLPDGQSRQRVGDRQDSSAEAILVMEPDVLMIQQNPDQFEQVRRLDPSIAVEHFQIETLADVRSAIERVGKLAGDEQLGVEKARQFADELQAVRDAVASRPRPRVLLVMGYDSPSTGGEGTFIGEMIETAGGVNAAVLRGYKGWVNLYRENIQAMAPDVLVCLVSDQGQEQQARQYWQGLSDVPAVRNGRVFVVTDPRWTIPSIYSPRYVGLLAQMIHPGAVKQDTVETLTAPQDAGETPAPHAETQP